MNIALENKARNLNLEIKGENLQKKEMEEEVKINNPIPSKRQQDLVNASTTFINLNSDEPVGLDLNKFLSPEESMIDTGYSNDLSVITELGDQHNVFKGVITKRINSLRMVSKWWSESNISSALNSINM